MYSRHVANATIFTWTNKCLLRYRTKFFLSFDTLAFSKRQTEYEYTDAEMNCIVEIIFMREWITDFFTKFSCLDIQFIYVYLFIYIFFVQSFEEQKLIYSGQLLNDAHILKDILRQYEGQETHTVHLVLAPKIKYHHNTAQKKEMKPILKGPTARAEATEGPR